jgi:hypothetical protein
MHGLVLLRLARGKVVSVVLCSAVDALLASIRVEMMIGNTNTFALAGIS